MVETLSALAARPPTPPRVSSRSEISGQAGNRPGSNDILPGTPEESPPSSQAGLTSSQPEPGSKRVIFSPWTDYIKPLPFTKSSSQSKLPLKALRPSNECKPSKSILKASTTNVPRSPTENLRTDDPGSLATMWESVVQQLSGESRNSRLDAYMHLFGALKAYDGMLEENGMPEKIGLVTQFIQRDIRQESGEYETQEINLVSYALKLLTVLVWNPQLAVYLLDEFRSFVIDRATAALQDTRTPKTIISHYMYLLATQTFQQKIMTASRALKLVTILQSITDHINGNAVIAQRLMIYQRLLIQAKSTMATHANLWIQHLFTGLFHHIKDTRTKAVAFGLQAATTFGPNLSISNAVRATLTTQLDDGRKYLSEMAEHLTRMISSREKGVHVPPIWSIVVLLLRTRKSPVERWEHFKEWLLIIQKCFNCSDAAIKTQAMIAWNRFVSAVYPGESTGLSMVRMLSKPIISQIERRKIEKLGTQPNPTAFSSYCNLLYYAFRPSTSHKHLDLFWKEYVSGPYSTVFSSGPTINDRASQVLSSLLWNPQLKIWSENRANDATKLEPDELPVLDCKWVRSRVSSVLEVFESLFKTSMWREDDLLHESNIALAWTSFSKALGEASSKEIKPSSETMHAIASILGMFQRLWNRGPEALNVDADCGDEDAFLNRFRFLAKTVVSSMGPIPFTENLLLKSSTKEAFQTANNTPTHRRPNADGGCKTPILHFLQLIGTLPATVTPGPAYRLLISDVLEICSHARSSRGSRLELCRQFGELHLHNPLNDQFARYVWEVTSDLVKDCLNTTSTDTTKGRDGSLSRDHVNIIIKILEAGVQFTESSSEWSQLTNTLVEVVRTQRREDIAAITIIESLSECLQKQNINTAVTHTGVLLKLAIQADNAPSESHYSPRPFKFTSYPSPHQAQQSEFGYEKLINLTENTLFNAYRQFEELDSSTVLNFLEAVDSSLHSCPSDVRAVALENLQGGTSLWLADRDHRLGVNLGADRKLLATVRKLSKTVATTIQELTEHDGHQLTRFEDIISSGLETYHKSIANTFIVMWNGTFGLQSYLEYPESVESALRKLEPFVDLQLPSFPRATESQEGEPTPPEFLNTQDDLSNLASQTKSFDQQKIISSPLNLVLSSRLNSSSPANRSGNQPPSSTVTTPKSGRRRRRRHDDSQVEFVAVESSPSKRHENGDERESQYLTEHQREVKERQRNESSTIFPDFKSSSPSAVGNLTPRKLRGQSGLRTETSRDTPIIIDDDIPVTPTIGAALAENEEEFPVSSPTPTSQNPKSISVEDVGEPSSCPTNEDLSELKPLDPPSSPPDSNSQRRGDEAASKSVSLTPEFEPDSQEQDGRGVDTSEKPSWETAVEHPEEEEAGSDSILEPTAQEEVEGSPRSAQSLEPLSRAEDEESMEGEDLTKQVESTPDPTHISVEFSDSADHGTPSQPNANREIDMVPDSFVSDMDSQVASQLGQDLELAIVQRNEEDETPRKKKRPGRPRSERKRLREQEAAAVSESPKRMRTRSFGLPSESEKSGGRKDRRSRKSKTSEGQSETPASTSKTRRSKMNVVESGESSVKTRKRSRSIEAGDEDRESLMTESFSSQPDSKKRRSRRISGSAVSEVPEVVGDGSMRKRRQKARRGQYQEYMHTVSPQQPEKETKAIVPQQDDGMDADSMAVVVSHGNEVAMDNVEVESSLVPATNAPILISQGTQTDTPAEREVVEASEAGILGSLRRVLGAIRTVTWGRPALREIDDVMFDIRVEAHDANRRHDG
ncbi:hypothetical protein FQN54_001832 [Arachnomyces sp. PD_36]|nr:hypothetical protein FQN54_001832 [Arachnomyces sp. PD_36]